MQEWNPRWEVYRNWNFSVPLRAGANLAAVVGQFPITALIRQVDYFRVRDDPGVIHQDNGPEFVAKDLRKWLAKVGTVTLYIEPESPWENVCGESFNGKLRDDYLNGEIFYLLKEAQIVVEKWRRETNRNRPHSTLGYRFNGHWL